MDVNITKGDGSRVSFIGTCKKSNTIQMDTGHGRSILKMSLKSEDAIERKFFPSYANTGVVCDHQFHDFVCENDTLRCIIRHHCTEYTLSDLVHSFRTADFAKMETIMLTLPQYTQTDFIPFWYDPVVNTNVYADIMSRLAPTLLQCLTHTTVFVDAIVANGHCVVLTLDNQNLNGNWLDFGDFTDLQIPGVGVAATNSYYSYLLPLLGATQCFSSVFDPSFNEFGYDFTEQKLLIYSTYFRWERVGIYHPNCVDCVDEECLLFCSNLNVLLSMYIPFNYLGPLCSIEYFNGMATPFCAGLSSVELGIVHNSCDLPSDPILKACLIFGTPPIHVVSSTPTADTRLNIPCVGSGKLMPGKLLKPAMIDTEFYEFVKDALLYEGSPITIEHFFYLQPRDCAVTDFDYYRFNRPTVLDPLQFRFVYNVVKHYFKSYSAGCLKSEFVIINNPHKSSGFPFNQLGDASDVYDFLGHERVDELYAYTKRSVLPTLTKIITKDAISAKTRARTVAGVGILSTATNRCAHQHMLKDIAAQRGRTVVIGTPKFYGGWHEMLSRFNDNRDRKLFGWDYPKCDRSMPNLLRMSAAWMFLNKHPCCSLLDNKYRLANELSQVLSETCVVNGAFYRKPGGTSSGDATTAYANSAFNLFQVITSAVNRCMSTDRFDYRSFNHELYSNIYLLDTPDRGFVEKFYNFMDDTCPLMILSDDGVAGPLVDHPLAIDVSDFRATLFYQNNVYLDDSKCWTEADVLKGPHEFCSQHTILHEGIFYPVPNPSRILAACMFVNSMEKADPKCLVERLVSLAIDAYPLVHHSIEVYRRVFPQILAYIKQVVSSRDMDIYDMFGEFTDFCSGVDITSETFYARLYKCKSSLQSSTNLCILCGVPSVVSCADCVRKFPLCCSCLYHHVADTNHSTIQSFNEMKCNAPGCEVSDCRLLSYGLSSGNDGSMRCEVHSSSSVKLALYNKETQKIFAFGHEHSSYDHRIHKINLAISRNFSHPDDYNFYDYPTAVLLAMNEMAKALEECVKDDYKPGTITSVANNDGINICNISWQGKVPPINQNSKFIAHSGRSNFGEIILKRTSSGSSIYAYESTAGISLKVGCVLKLTSHGVVRLTQPPLLTAPLALQYVAPGVVSTRYDNRLSVQFFYDVARKFRTTVQGPPGTGKSFLLAGLPEFFAYSKILYLANSHAAVNALCQKAFNFGLTHECSRIKPMSTTHNIFSGFAFNDNTRRILFSTVNSVPSCTVDIVVLDEVSMCSDSDLSLINSRVRYKRCVFVGDPQQLSATRTLCRSALDPSIYNSVTRSMIIDGPDIFLDKCYRCPKEVVDICSSLCYNDRLTPVKPVSNECWSTCISTGLKCAGGDTGCYNTAHVAFIKRFILQNPNFASAVFISPYHTQNQYAFSELGLRTYTVDSSQGSEFPYVIYSQTSGTSFACNKQRFNVAISRAIKGILVVAFDSSFNCFTPYVNKPTITPPTTALQSFNSQYLEFKGAEKAMPTITPEEAIKSLDGCVAIDMEFVHSHGQMPPTQYLLQIGLAKKNAGSFVVKPHGFRLTTTGLVLQQLKPNEYHFAPNFGFQRAFLRSATSMSVFIDNILSFIARSTTGRVILVSWAPLCDMRQMPLFCRLGPIRKCRSCANTAVFTDCVCYNYYCQQHYNPSCRFLYNPVVCDTRSVEGNLGSAHDSVCSIVHGKSHDASVDARMTFCWFLARYLNPSVAWDIRVSSHHKLNSYLRKLQRVIINSVVKSDATILDVGNPIARVFTGHKYSFIDSAPINSSVAKLKFTPSLANNFDYCLFWNCNLTSYPNNSIVCRLTDHVFDPLALPGPNGSICYVNKRVFYHSSVCDVGNLTPWKFCYFDEDPCDVDFVPASLPVNALLTKCNTGSVCCRRHYNAFHHTRQIYQYVMANSGFRFYIPSKTQNQSLTLALNSVVLGLSHITTASTKSVSIDKFTISGDAIYYGGNLVYTNEDPSLPITVAFEKFMYRCCIFMPNNQFLHNLDFNYICGFSNYSLPVSYSVMSGFAGDVPVAMVKSTLGLAFGKIPFADFMGLVISNDPINSTSVLYHKGETSGIIDGVFALNVINVYYTYVNMPIPPVTYMSVNRSLLTFIPMTAMEDDYLSLSSTDFITKYSLENFNLEHILYGEFSSPTVGGLHLMISVFKHYKSYDATFHNRTVSSLSSVLSYQIVTRDSTKLSTLIDITIDSFVAILKSLDLTVVSKVVHIPIDGKPIDFMLWAHAGNVATFYPLPQVLQNSVIKRVSAVSIDVALKSSCIINASGQFGFTPTCGGVAGKILSAFNIIPSFNEFSTVTIPILVPTRSLLIPHVVHIKGPKPNEQFSLSNFATLCKQYKGDSCYVPFISSGIYKNEITTFDIVNTFILNSDFKQYYISPYSSSDYVMATRILNRFANACPSLLQATAPNSVYKVPTSVFYSDCDLVPIDIPNYGKSFKTTYTVDVGMCFLKYTQLLQYLNFSTTTPNPMHNKLQVLNCGAADINGHSPGSDAILAFFRPDTPNAPNITLHDLDCNLFTSAAAVSFHIAIEQFSPGISYDLIISDIYNSDDLNYFTSLERIIKSNLSFGGTFVIKMTETRYSDVVFQLCKHCSWWGIVFTRVNASSSEYFLIGTNYNPHVFNETLPDFSSVRAGYAWFRNSCSFRLDFCSLLAPGAMVAKNTGTVILNSTKGKSYLSVQRQLWASGSLLVRRC